MTQTATPSPAQVPKFDLAEGSLSRPQFIAMMASMMALNALAIDIMLPAFPAMQASYAAANADNVHYVLTTYLIGFGFAQLFFGPLSDRYGRRTPLFIGMGLYITFAILGALAPSFALLLAARFFQGVGAAATRVITLAIVRDTHAGRAMASTMSLVMMVFMTVPVFAPMLGQVIITFGDWHAIFLAMAAMAMAVWIWSAKHLPETLGPDQRRPLTAAAISNAFAIVFSNRISVCYTLATAFFFGALFGFLNVAQPIYVDIYGLGSWFPVAFGGVAVLMALASFFNSRLVGSLGQRRLSHGALIGFCALSALLAFISVSGNPPFWLFMTIFAITMALFGLIGANMNSLAMEPLGAVAGTASSVLGFTQTVGGSLTGALIGYLYAGQLFTLALGNTVLSLIAIGFVLLAERGKLFASINPSTN